VIYSGQGTPASTIGVVGDYYIDDTHAILYGPKTASGWPATGLSLQVNNTITYDFVDKVQHNLPYQWQVPVIGIVQLNQVVDQIVLPYNNTAAQTTGFTIPQAIVDNGMVLCYMRFFSGPANDTATDAGMTPWIELPYSTIFTVIVNDERGFVPIYLATSFDDNGFNIAASCSVSQINPTWSQAYTPAVIRIVLIPAGQINTVTGLKPGEIPGKTDKLFTF
jgi:hypothetical protein